MALPTSASDWSDAYAQYLGDLTLKKRQWVRKAACLELHTSSMFPSRASQQRRVAERVCGVCPVKTECLELALAHFDINGVWGGCTESQLRMLTSYLRRKTSDVKNTWTYTDAAVVARVARIWTDREILEARAHMKDNTNQ